MSKERILSSEHLHSALENSTLEIYPSTKILRNILLLPHGHRINVASSPERGIDKTISISESIRFLGNPVVPHISARAIKSREHLIEISDRLFANDIEEIFLVGGDGEPEGDYSDAYSLLNDLLKFNTNIKTVGFAGYPEGHPFLNRSALEKSLDAKIDLAHTFGLRVRVDTQLCFDGNAILEWSSDFTKRQPKVPVFLGISAPVRAIKLYKIASRVGVGDSLRFLKTSEIGFVRKLLAYNPKDLLSEIFSDPRSEQIKGFHIFTFNEIDSTRRFVKRVGKF